MFAIYLVSLLWLSVALFIYSQHADRSPSRVLYVLGVAAGTIFFYITALGLLGRTRPSWTADLPVPPSSTMSPRRHKLLALMVGAYGIIALVHFLLLGNVPVLEVLTVETDLGASIVRQQGYFGLPGFMRYASDYAVKAIGPALLLIAYYFRSRLFWMVLVIGVVYTLGLFARILPIILFLPLLVYLLLLRRWVHLAGAIAMVAALVGAITITSSIALRESTLHSIEKVMPEEKLSGVVRMPKTKDPLSAAPLSAAPLSADPLSADHDWRRTSTLYALYERALVVPGQVIYQWFDYYDEPARREHGCGYPLLASWVGCSYVPVPSKLYAAFYSEQYDQGMRGSLNAASFMTEYANFGPRGLVLSALMAGCLFVAARVIYRNHPLALPLNLPLIVSVMEGNIVTAINSGAGWLVMTSIFLIFFRARKQ